MLRGIKSFAQGLTASKCQNQEGNLGLSNSVVLNQEQFCTPGHIWQCLQTFLVVKTGHGDAAVRQWVEAGDPSVQRTAPRPQQRVTQSKMSVVPHEKPGSK